MRRLPYTILILIVSSLVIHSQSPHGDEFDLDCELCHETVSWDVTPDKIKFDHTATGFEIIGQHSSVDCESCHKTLVFSEVESNCISCHTDIHQGTVGKDCVKCHTSKSWIVEDISNVHQLGRFPLVGKHQVADCQQCHTRYVDLYFEPLNVDCFSCHSDDYISTNSPNHTDAGFSTECQDCHDYTALSWSSTGIIHDFFPLIGGHAISNCFACHQQGGNFTGLSTECYSCHQQDYESVQDPNHVASNYNFDCTECHTINSWDEIINFNHNITQFELTGAHINIDCSLCHEQGYNGTPVECFACHEENYNNTSNPNHLLAGFPTTCEDCHETSDWIPSTFDHDQQFFPIYSGTHAGEWDLCSDCHEIPNDFSVFTCISCHEHNQQDMDDKHAGIQGYVYASQECFACHPTGEKGTAFNHAISNFPLTGAHITLDCGQCHSSGYSGTPLECFACHEVDYNSSTNPDHLQLGISTDCESCHTTEPNWEPALFPQHNQIFELVGAHLQISNDCSTCHNGDYINTPVICVGCHESAYNNASNPDHLAAGISTDCEQCHNTIAWIPSTFDHITTGFELIGAHSIIECSDCHEGTTGGLNSNCLTCHEDEYNATVDPPHLLLGFSDDCLECHNMNGWLPANFDHNFYPLSGDHITLNCNECHAEPNYQPQCLSCHLQDFQEEHQPGDPTDCWSCHNTFDWRIELHKSILQRPE